MNACCPGHSPAALSRRGFLAQAAAGILAASPAARALAAAERAVGFENPLAPKAPHFPGRAKRVIMLYMSGAYSHVDTFDPKPRLTRDHEKTVGGDGAAGIDPKDAGRFLLRPGWEFQPNARCGTMVSDLFPYIRDIMDDVALIRSLHCDFNNHGEATLQIHTGSGSLAMPGLGAWLSHALGTENPNLPSHVVIAEHLPYAGAQPFDCGFLPPAHRGLRFEPGANPLPHLKPASPKGQQELELAALHWLNRRHLEQHGFDRELRGRMETFHAARGLQDVAPEAIELATETDATLESYGLKRGDRTSYGAQCVMARRLIERGVRFVEIIDTIGNCQDNWDSAHREMKQHAHYAKRVDQPIAALIRDLKARGMFDDTLVVFCTEFGRTPWSQDGKGKNNRQHHPGAFSCWLAGGGVKPGIVYGASDDIGNKVVENPVHVHDFHATILHLLGFDHTKLTYRHAGRDYRLTDVFGKVVKGVLA
ncbi:MAG: DUF1501 domain-containing protein [Opitutus sp.]|nr:DUF1501 domain-containing protein [Opitutus sp.]